jgi:hypothetical protein
MSHGQLYIGADDYQNELEGQFAGDYQIVGDDNDSTLADIFSGEGYYGADGQWYGADPRRRPAPRGPGAPVKQGMRVTDQQLHIVKQQIMPLPIVTFLAGQTLNVEATPQRPIRVERLVVPSWLARYFDIFQINVGQEQQYVNTGAVNATVFSEVAVGVRLRGDTANVGNKVTLNCQNIDTGTRDFRGTVFGTTLTRA